MTSEARRTVVIDRPVEEVFAFFTQPDNDRRWRPHVKEITAGGPVAAGSTIHQVVAGPVGLGLPADLLVTAYEPPSRYAFAVVAGPARPVGEFRFDPAESGTQVTFSLRAELRGLRKLLLSRPVQRSMEAELAALDTAKEVIEGTGPS